MKKIIFIVSSLIIFSFFIFAKKNTEPMSTHVPSIYEQKFSIKDIDGNPIDFQQFKGKKVLLVNVASECGFTSQYEELQKLHEQYGSKLVVIGLPCNQFNNQEPGTTEEIKSFCSTNYGVTFLMTEKIDVKGENQHPIYKWLTEKELNGFDNSSVKWNFQKYLLDEEGALLDFYYSVTKPLSENITKHLK